MPPGQMQCPKLGCSKESPGEHVKHADPTSRSSDEHSWDLGPGDSQADGSQGRLWGNTFLRKNIREMPCAWEPRRGRETFFLALPTRCMFPWQVITLDVKRDFFFSLKWEFLFELLILFFYYFLISPIHYFFSAVQHGDPITNAGEKGTLLHCWWECILLQPIWRTVWKDFRKLYIELPYDQSIPFWGIYLDKTFLD